jgi:hypothetical protein
MAEITTGQVTYTVDAKTLAVSSASAKQRMIAILDSAVQAELLDYSPALGDKLIFAANVVARIVGGKVVAGTVATSEKGVVY